MFDFMRERKFRLAWNRSKLLFKNSTTLTLVFSLNFLSFQKKIVFAPSSLKLLPFIYDFSTSFIHFFALYSRSSLFVDISLNTRVKNSLVQFECVCLYACYCNVASFNQFIIHSFFFFPRWDCRRRSFPSITWCTE
jgi:hypothetical protein